MQLPQSTCPQGLARTALELLLRPFLQAGQIRTDSWVLSPFSSAKWTVMRPFREYGCLVNGVDAGQIGCSLLGFSFGCMFELEAFASTPGTQKEASV
jgi:hypothetical protein